MLYGIAYRGLLGLRLATWGVVTTTFEKFLARKGRDCLIILTVLFDCLSVFMTVLSTVIAHWRRATWGVVTTAFEKFLARKGRDCLTIVTVLLCLS